jgi:hypothetical protein
MVSAGWELWREDDNGNKFRVSVHEDRAGAEAALDAYENAPSHKQTYFVKESGGDSPAQTSPARR